MVSQLQDGEGDGGGEDGDAGGDGLFTGPDGLLKAELEAIRRIRERVSRSREFKSEIHQRKKGYEVGPAEEGSPHNVNFKIRRTLVTVVHSHTSDTDFGSERGSRDQNTARNAPANVITVYPGGAVTRIDTRGNVTQLKGGEFVPLP